MIGLRLCQRRRRRERHRRLERAGCSAAAVTHHQDTLARLATATRTRPRLPTAVASVTTRCDRRVVAGGIGRRHPVVWPGGAELQTLRALPSWIGACLADQEPGAAHDAEAGERGIGAVWRVRIQGAAESAAHAVVGRGVGGPEELVGEVGVSVGAVGEVAAAVNEFEGGKEVEEDGDGDVVVHADGWYVLRSRVRPRQTRLMLGIAR